MSKAELLHDLDEENKQYERLLSDIGEGRMEQPGVAGFWSVKDIVAHITAWRRRTVQRLQAAARGEAAPPPEWPRELKADDAINAWFHERDRNKSVRQVLDESRQVFEQMRAGVEALPEAMIGNPSSLPWLEGNPLTARVLFSHFHDEHEADMRAWLAKQEAA